MNDYLRALKNLGGLAKDAAAQVTAKAIEEYWPMIESLWRERIGPAALAVARDDTKLADVARTIYPSLPLALRLCVKESEFINFCLTNRNRLVALCETVEDSSEKQEGRA